MVDPLSGLAPGLLLAAALVLAAVVLAAVRLAGPHERIVVVRRGRSRLAGPGLVLTLPGLERSQRISVAQRRATTAVGRARTGDGVEVFVALTVTFRVVDPLRAKDVDPRDQVERVVDDELRVVLAGAGLADLAPPSAGLAGRVRAAANGRLAPHGLRVDGLTIDDAELPVDVDLLRWADRRTPGRPAGRRG